MSKMTECKTCGNQIATNAKACPNCGAKIKKPIYKKWWFWLIIGLAFIMIVGVAGSDSEDSPSPSGESTTATSEITYEIVDLQTMIDDLNNNAMKAEALYQNKYVQIEGRITNFDSDGKYISVEALTADAWNFDTVMCYIKSDAQRQILINKSVDDVVTIKGRITSIGEVLGYSLNIDEIQ